MDLSKLRREYSRAGLKESGVEAAPWAQFQKWFAEAQAAGLPEPNAMLLATADARGRPGARTVLLKACDERGLVFFTNYRSRKAGDIAAQPEVALLFPWHALERQVAVEGRAERVSRAESEDYFARRPRGSQLGAWVSEQSRVLATREELEKKLAAVKKKFRGGKVPCPPHWGGYRMAPRVWEFWQGRPNRLHDRLRYRLDDAGKWVLERLAP